jgi:hypothetical protein
MFFRPEATITLLGTNLLTKLVTLGSQHITFPFKCNDKSWRHFDCVNDIAIAVPGHLFSAFEIGCLGRSGCFPDAYGDAFGGHGAAVAWDERSINEPLGASVIASGHACHRCVAAAQKNFALWRFQKRPIRFRAGETFENAQLLECSKEGDDSLTHPDKCEAWCLSIPHQRCRAWAVGAGQCPALTCALYSYVAGKLKASAYPNVVSLNFNYHNKIYVRTFY